MDHIIISFCLISFRDFNCCSFPVVEYNKICRDSEVPLDWCNDIVGLCMHGICQSENDGYLCQCHLGYVLTPDGARCIGKLNVVVMQHIKGGGGFAGEATEFCF